MAATPKLDQVFGHSTVWPKTTTTSDSPSVKRSHSIGDGNSAEIYQRATFEVWKETRSIPVCLITTGIELAVYSTK